MNMIGRKTTFYPFEANKTVASFNKNPIVWGDPAAAQLMGTSSMVWPQNTVQQAFEAATTEPYPFPRNELNLTVPNNGSGNNTGNAGGKPPLGGIVKNLPSVVDGIGTGGLTLGNDFFAGVPFEERLVNLGKRLGGYILGIALVALGVYAILRG